VQDKQRPLPGGSSFEVATSFLATLSERGCDFLVRITVTNESLGRLRESVQFVIEDYAPSSIIINPVYVCGSCTNEGVESVDYRAFLEAFLRVQDLGESRGIDIVSPYDKLSYSPIAKAPYCGFERGNFFITPDGYLSACSEIDNMGDVRAPVFFFGRVDDIEDLVIVNEEKLAQIYALSEAHPEMCGGCQSSSLCPGFCLVRKLSGPAVVPLGSALEGCDPTAELDDVVMERLVESKPSYESLLQCAMTNGLSRAQTIRAVRKGGMPTKLSVAFDDVTATLGLREHPEITKVVKLRMSGVRGGDLDAVSGELLRDH
jgi:radical SAM protein with 4Fe4S-binding SPASM domain